MQKIAVFASGSGSNAQCIIEYFEKIDSVRVAVVVTNRKQAGVIQRAENLGIAVEYVPKSKFVDDTDSVLRMLENYGVDFVVLAGFLLQIPAAIVSRYQGRIVNIHPALLPDFGGAGMYGSRVHEAVLAAGRSRSGITIHYVDNEYDRGEIIFQAEIDVVTGDSVDSLQAKIQRLEHEHYPRVIDEVLKMNRTESGDA